MSDSQGSHGVSRRDIQEILRCLDRSRAEADRYTARLDELSSVVLRMEESRRSFYRDMQADFARSNRTLEGLATRVAEFEGLFERTFG